MENKHLSANRENEKIGGGGKSIKEKDRSHSICLSRSLEFHTAYFSRSV